MTAANHLSVPDLPGVDITGSYVTVACFVRNVVDTGGWQTLMGKTGGGAAGQYAMGRAGGGNMFGTLADGVGEDLNTGGAIPLGGTNFMHLCFVKDGSGGPGLQRFYRDGALDASPASSRVIQNTTYALGLGTDNPVGLPGNCEQAECAVWDVALTTPEVLALAKGVKPTLIRLRNLRGYWPLLGLALPEVNLARAGENAATLGGAPAATARQPPGGRWKPFAG
jgi:hypothetical protein